MVTFVVLCLFLFVLPFLPESPVLYMKKGREDDARKAIIKLFGNGVDVEQRLSVIKSELEMMDGEAYNASQTSCRAIFSKERCSRIFVAVLRLQSQNFLGGYFASKICTTISIRIKLIIILDTYQTYYFELISQTNAFKLTTISLSLQFRSNLFAVCVSDVLPHPKITSWRRYRPSRLARHHRRHFSRWCFQYCCKHSPTGIHDHLDHDVHWYRWCFGWAVAQETASQSTRPKTIAFALVCQQLIGKCNQFFVICNS